MLMSVLDILIRGCILVFLLLMVAVCAFIIYISVREYLDQHKRNKGD